MTIDWNRPLVTNAGKPARKIRIDGDVAYVPLTRGYEAIIDADQVGMVSGSLWAAHEDRGTVYARAKRGQKTVLMHRLLTGAVKGQLVDHINCNGLDNRRCNLRLADHAQNAHNQRARTTNKSGVKGVTWRSSAAKWHARIRTRGVERHLGFFDDFEAACAAYANASRELHGDFSRIA
jgi:hypothetical protein